MIGEVGDRGAIAEQARPVGGQRAGQRCVAEWVDVVLACFGVENGLQLGEFVRVLVGEVHTLAEVAGEVVELPAFGIAEWVTAGAIQGSRPWKQDAIQPWW